MLTTAQTRAYLDRIGYAGDPQPDRETLSELVRLHQLSIPFETVRMHRTGELPSLDTDVIFDLLVTQRLGGYCFEMNKLFEELLATIGYDVRPALSRVVRGREGRMPINHRGVIVTPDDDMFSADVGFGGPMPAGAIMLSSGDDQMIAGELYAAVRDDHAWWRIERVTQASADLFDDEAPVRRQVELELCSAAVEDIDFDSMNMYFSAPGSLFRDHVLVNLRTPNGYLGMRDNVLTIRESGQKTVIELDSREAQDAALREHFGLAY